MIKDNLDVRHSDRFVECLLRTRFTRLSCPSNLACQLLQSRIIRKFLPRKGVYEMELQSLVTTSMNCAQLSPISGHCEYPKGTATFPSSSDLENGAVLESIRGRLHGQRPVEPGIDYVRASDQELVTAAKSSVEPAFEELSNRHRRSIYNVVYRMVGNREDAEDVVQDSLLKAYCRLSDFRGSCSFSTWITAIAINTARMLLRKRRTLSELPLVQSGGTDHTEQIWDIPDPSPGTEQRFFREKTLEFMLRAVNRLPSVYRSVLEQYHSQEKPMREVADTLGISVASAKSRLFRARRILRSKLKGQRLSVADAC